MGHTVERPKVRWRLLAVALVVLLLAAACGSDGGDAGSDTADDGASEPAPAETEDTATEGPESDAAAPPEDAAAEDLGTISVGLICGGLTPMTAMMAINADTFPEGLEVEKLCFDGGSEAVQALIGGSLDVFMGSVEHVLSTQEKGLPTRAYAVINNRVPYSLISPEDSGVSSMSDLAGKQVGITSPGSLSDTELQIAAEQEGVAYDDLTVIGAGSGASMTAALSSGSIAAGMVSEPQLSEFLQSGYSLVWEPEFEYVAIAAVANSDNVAERTATFEAFLEGLTTAATDAESDTQFAVDAIKAEGFQVSDEVLQTAVEAGIESIPEGLTVDESVYDTTVELLQSVGKLEGDAPPFGEVIDSSLLPSS